MQIQRYGVTLSRVKATNLEQVRQWRNAPYVQENMEFREQISPRMQEAWFHGLDERRNLYFIFSSHGEEGGVVHLKDIDWNAQTAEAGVFTGKVEWLGTFT